MSAETPKAVVPFTEEWFAYIISTRTEEGAIRCLSMMTQAELQRLRGLLDEARVAIGGMLDQFEHWEGSGGEGMDEDAKVIKAARKAFSKLKK